MFTSLPPSNRFPTLLPRVHVSRHNIVGKRWHIIFRGARENGGEGRNEMKIKRGQTSGPLSFFNEQPPPFSSQGGEEGRKELRRGTGNKRNSEASLRGCSPPEAVHGALSVNALEQGLRMSRDVARGIRNTRAEREIRERRGSVTFRPLLSS